MWGCCCPCTSCYYWYTECYSPSDCDCDCDCDCCCDSDFGVTDLLAGLCSIVFLPVIGVYYVCLMVYNGCAKCCGEGGCAEHVTAWDVLTYAVYIMFFPFIGIYIGCMHSGVPCMKWCISKEGDDVTFLCCSSPGWLQKYNFEDVCRFFLHLASVVFFSMDTFDMILDFIQVKKLADYCEHGFAGWLGLYVSFLFFSLLF